MKVILVKEYQKILGAHIIGFMPLYSFIIPQQETPGSLRAIKEKAPLLYRLSDNFFP